MTWSGEVLKQFYFFATPLWGLLSFTCSPICFSGGKGEFCAKIVTSLNISWVVEVSAANSKWTPWSSSAAAQDGQRAPTCTSSIVWRSVHVCFLLVQTHLGTELDLKSETLLLVLSRTEGIRKWPNVLLKSLNDTHQPSSKGEKFLFKSSRISRPSPQGLVLPS